MAATAETSPVLVVGGGPAGISAAIGVVRSGRKVLLVEQRDRLGGALHRQPATPDTPKVLRPASQEAAWRVLKADLAACRPGMTVATSTVFHGVDAAGHALLDNRRTGELIALRPAGMILAMGATETVHPFHGWELPGILTAGGAQVLLKETGRPLAGRTLVAGSGPLLLALSAQLCAAGSPPVAVLERSRPLSHPAAILSVLRSFRQVAEALGYRLRLLRSRVRYQTGTTILSAKQSQDMLAVEVERNGSRSTWYVHNLIVHDGIRPGPMAGDLSGLPFPVIRAGDWREILGGHCAIADGRIASAELLAKHGETAPRSKADEVAIRRARLFQAGLSRIFSSAPPEVRPDTVICRCEGRLAGELPSGISPREAKLVGRFGMGACQGRFCAEATARLLASKSGESEFRPEIMRWPLRPLSANALSRLRFVSTNIEKIWSDDSTIT